MLTDPTLGGLVLADTELALLYAECRERHAGAVAAYEAVRRETSK